MRMKLDVDNNDDVLDGADVRDDSPEPEDDDEPLRARQNPRAAVRAVPEVRQHEHRRWRKSLARGR